jgi:transcriptional regulator with XRE-family HTH domain
MSKKIIGYINGSYLKKLRIKHGYTPAEISEKLGIGLSTYYKWEGSKQIPSILRLQILQLVYKDIDFNKLLSLNTIKCCDSNCMDRERMSNEVR